MRWFLSMLLSVGLSGLVGGQWLGRGTEVWLEMVPWRSDPPSMGYTWERRDASFFFQVHPRWGIEVNGGRGYNDFFMYVRGFPLFPDIVGLERWWSVWIRARYSVWDIWKFRLSGEWGLGYDQWRVHGNIWDHLRGAPSLFSRAVINFQAYRLHASWGVVGEFPISWKKVRLGGYLRGIFPTFSCTKGERFWTRQRHVVWRRPLDGCAVSMNNFSWFEGGVLLRVRLGEVGSDAFVGLKKEGRSGPLLSVWRGWYLEFYRRDGLYDSLEDEGQPLLHAGMYYDSQLFEEILGARWFGYPWGRSWGVSLRWSCFGVGYRQWGRYWHYWRDWSPGSPWLMARYHGSVFHHSVEGSYLGWSGKRGEAWIRLGGVYRRGKLSRVIDTVGTNGHWAEWSSASLQEFGVGGGVRLEFRPVWFGYVYADGGVSHMLWGRMVDYHRTTWTLGVGAGVRISLEYGKEGE